MEDKDEQIETLLDDVLRKQKDTLEQWFKCFCSGSYNEQRRMAKQEIKNTLNSIHDRERFRNPRTNFIKKLLLTDTLRGYKFDGGPILARSLLGSMKHLPYWKEYIEALEDDFIEKLLEKVKERDETLLLAWFRCFEGTESEQRMEAKCEIKKTLRDDASQRDPEINFIMRLVSDGKSGYEDSCGACYKRDNLAKLFLFTMKEIPYWKEMLDATLSSSVSRNEGEPIIPRAKWNYVTLEQIKDTYKLSENTTLLLKAARLEDVETVKYLIEAGTQIECDLYGCSPLHFAAMAIHPNAEIARVLIEALTKMGKFYRVTERSDETFAGANTALHTAAGNVNVTQEFIDQFKYANPVVFNSDNLSPFHVAAMSKNQNVIMYMLKTFAPTNNFWDVDEVDAKLLNEKKNKNKVEENDDDEKLLNMSKRKTRLINICARNGNAEAVALLIQHGANIRFGVLHEIVLESVKSPEKIDKLLDVYRSIVDNAVTWRCLEGNLVPPLKDSNLYRNNLRDTMIGLLTNPLKAYDNKDVLEYAISLGAAAMFQHIVNTNDVFRYEFDNDWPFTIQGCCNRFVLKPGYSAVLYDVTHFIPATQLEIPEKDTESDKSMPTTKETTAILSSAGQQHSTPAPEENKEQDGKPNFTERRRPDMPYLSYMLSFSGQWKNSNILSTPPLKQLTKPYFALIQRFFFLVGLMQLVFMVLFSVYYTPDTCSLSLMFNVNITHCNSISSSSNNSELSPDANDNHTTSSNITLTTQQRSLPTWFWLIWPIILITGNTAASPLFVKFRIANYTTASANFGFKRKPTLLAREFRKVVLQSVTLRIFCCMVFAWFYMYRNGETQELYTEVTAMVLLFGWLTNLDFFGAINKTFSISALVVREIIEKDIPSFMLFFVFTVVGFSFSIHALRMSTCEQNYVDFRDTFYGVFSSAFGIGDFFETTVSDRSCEDAGTKHFFEVVYFTYIGITLIILLNILIAMMNNRYELSKQRSENIWRFRLLSTMCAVFSYKIFIKVFEEHQLLDLWRPGNNPYLRLTCAFGCCFNDKYNGHLLYLQKHKRFFLMFMLKPDERTELLHYA